MTHRETNDNISLDAYLPRTTMSNRNLFRADFLFAAENEGKIIERRRVRINNALSQQYLVFFLEVSEKNYQQHNSIIYPSVM